jgi:hypothetical protein
MPDYNKGKIYTIRCRTDDTLIYVGSTIQSLGVRIGGHKIKSRDIKCHNMILYKTINNNWDDWYIELYEEYPCENKEQLNKREGEIIRLIGTLNILEAGRTRQEYYQDNKEELLKIKKEYYENNKDKIKETQKAYNNNNREQKIEYNKIYHNNNKERAKEHYIQRITCECGCIINRGDISKHKKTQKHIKLLDTLNIN